MKILFLSDANSSHTIKWVNGLAEHGVLIHLMTLSTLIRIYMPKHQTLQWNLSI